VKRQQKRRLPSQVRPALIQRHSGVSQIIRSAEKFLSEGRCDLAIQQLQQARELDPANQYIDAIIVRAQTMRDSQLSPLPGRDPAMESPRYLSVTIGKEFSGGIRQDEANSSEQVRQQIQKQIQKLTDTATVLLTRGLGEGASEALMKAYLLDPMNPDVIACEERVLPAWNKIREGREDLHAAADALEAQKSRPSDHGRQGFNLLRTLRGKA
jgi:hypothetical protein